VTEEQVRDGAVAVPGRLLGEINLLVDRHRMPGVARERVEDAPHGVGVRLRLIRPAVAIAPALIIGCAAGRCPASRLIELKASPDGSTQTFSRTGSNPWSSSARP